MTERLRIVVADNDLAVVDLLRTDMRLEGHDVVAVAMSGEAAIEACRMHRPDVLICDFRMPPGLDGLETIKRVRDEGTAGCCILYSNYRSPTIATVTARIGGIYVNKGPLRTLRAALPHTAASA